jgi:TolA-binding protein
MERIMDEVEDEVLYIREEKTPEPVFYIPYDELDNRGAKYYPHLDRRAMTNDEMRANKIKLDSILIKGSKLMARNSKSDYLPDAIFYIGKGYFYLREWYQSAKKCEELIAGFPDSKWYPDAHLVLSMDLMEQGRVPEAARMLSRTIDVGWASKRRDILIEAFRLNADLQLAEGNVGEAIKPYERAMVLSTDDEERARWRYEIGLIHFRQGDFKTALDQFAQVDDLSPDILTQFQTGMQRAAAYRALGQYDEAEKQLADLRDNGNFDQWYGLVELEKTNLAGARAGGNDATDSTLAAIDTLSPGKGYSAYAIYERAVRAYRAGDYQTAITNFTKVQSANVPFQRRAARYSALLGRYFEQLGRANALSQGYTADAFPDSLRGPVAESYYTIARVFASLDKPDSMNYYYDLTSAWAKKGSPEAARVIYARAMMLHDSGRTAASDSMLQVIVDDYPLTEFADDARKRLGYTDYAKIDTAQDLYLSGTSFMKVGDNARALTQFQRLVAGYPSSTYAPQAYYAIGLLYEDRLDNRDSAYSYYGRLLDLYPKSDQAAEVRPIIEAVNIDRMRRPRAVPGDTSGTGSTPPATPPPSRAAPPPFDEVPPQEQLIPLGADTTRNRAPINGPSGTNSMPGTPAVPPPPASTPGSVQTGGAPSTPPATPPKSDGQGTTATPPSSGTDKPPKRPVRPKR